MLKKLALAAALFALPFVAQAAGKIGDAAPSLDSIKLVKIPDSLKKSKDKICKDLLMTDSKVVFEKGKVYIVEFWASWCGPCRRVFPHLADLQKKHGDDLIVLGMTRPDRGQNEAMISAMANHPKAQMNYRVCIDANGEAYKNFFDAFGCQGIPSAFIVDKEGKITFVGHPASPDMEKKLNEALGIKKDDAKDSKVKSKSGKGNTAECKVNL